MATQGRAGAREHPRLVTEQGKAIPYGIYDVERNVGWVNVGQDHETTAFAVESLRRRWRSLVYSPTRTSTSSWSALMEVEATATESSLEA